LLCFAQVLLRPLYARKEAYVDEVDPLPVLLVRARINLKAWATGCINVTRAILLVLELESGFLGALER
jgi:hypothetical protein